MERNFKPAKVIFFTATPDRADRREITTDGALSNIGYAYKLSLKSAIENRLIRKVNFTILDDEIDSPPLTTNLGKSDEPLSPDTKKQKKKDEKMDYAKIVLHKVKECMDEKNEASPLPANKNHTSIIIAYSIDEATAIKAMCKSVGFSSESIALVHSSNKERENDAIVGKIKADKYEIVIIVGKLLEGFDYPPFSTAGIVTRIRSSSKFAQFIGRVQRLVRENGEIEEENVEADVITHKYFEQEKLREKYLDPTNPPKEDKCLDEDDAE